MPSITRKTRMPTLLESDNLDTMPPSSLKKRGGQRQLKIAVGVEQGAGGDAHQQRGVDLFGVQGQHDGHHRGNRDSAELYTAQV